MIKITERERETYSLLCKTISTCTCLYPTANFVPLISSKYEHKKSLYCMIKSSFPRHSWLMSAISCSGGAQRVKLLLEGKNFGYRQITCKYEEKTLQSLTSKHITWKKWTLFQQHLFWSSLLTLVLTSKS